MSAEARPRVATEADLPAVAETLALAFEQEPIWSWAFAAGGAPAQRERRLEALRAVFGFCAAAGLRYGGVRVSGGVEAVALWVPPGEREMTAAEAERFPGLIRASVGDPATAERILTLMAAFDCHRPAEPPHWFLGSLGTHPDHAGHGYGMALLAANLEEVDASGAPAFLETGDPANVPRYERLGFRVERRVELTQGIDATQMWREPPMGRKPLT